MPHSKYKPPQGTSHMHGRNEGLQESWLSASKELDHLFDRGVPILCGQSTGGDPVWGPRLGPLMASANQQASSGPQKAPLSCFPDLQPLKPPRRVRPPCFSGPSPSHLSMTSSHPDKSRLPEPASHLPSG